MVAEGAVALSLVVCLQTFERVAVAYSTVECPLDEVGAHDDLIDVVGSSESVELHRFAILHVARPDKQDKHEVNREE